MSSMEPSKIAEIVGVDKMNGEYPFKVVDTKSDHGLYMIHYDVDEIGNFSSDSPEKNLRGVIVSDMDGVLVPSFGYTPTIISNKYPTDSKEKLTDKDGNEYTLDEFGVKDVFPMLDGTLLRVWKYKDTIHISTHKKMDATNSRWGTSGKFVDLFNKYTEKTFKVEDLFTEDSAKDSKPVIHNFLLVDVDLMISSKLPLDSSIKEGFVVYINSLNCETPEILKSLPKIHYSEVSKTENTVFRISSLTPEEYDSYLNKGFYPELDDIDNNISLGEGLIIFNGNTMLKMISDSYNRRAKIVDNNPNIMHRVYELLDQAQIPKDGVDTFLEKFPAVPCPTNEQIENHKDNIISKFPAGWKLPSDQELTENNGLAREMRLRVAVTHYAMSLPILHQKAALTCTAELLKDRHNAIQIVTQNYFKFDKKQWEEDVSPRDLKVYERIHKMVIDAKAYANVRIKRGEEIKGITGSQLFNKFVKDNLRNLMLKEYGVSIYKIVRVLVNDPKKKNE